MRRRDFLASLSGAAAMWQLGVHAQPTAMPVVGVVSAGWPGDSGAAFRQGLGEAGYVDGKNVTIELRWAEGHPERLSAIAADFVNRRVTVRNITPLLNGGTASLPPPPPGTAPPR